MCVCACVCVCVFVCLFVVGGGVFFLCVCVCADKYTRTYLFWTCFAAQTPVSLTRNEHDFPPSVQRVQSQIKPVASNTAFTHRQAFNVTKQASSCSTTDKQTKQRMSYNATTMQPEFHSHRSFIYSHQDLATTKRKKKKEKTEQNRKKANINNNKNRSVNECER